ncbi:MAG: hypothetical protein E7556_01560 [Ruminococcaceae bacterium]|nr:hypothetical protein [Oscillospiraceae bacterium]
MSFRKDELFFIQTRIGLGLYLLLSFFIIYLDYFFSLFGFLSAFILLFIFNKGSEEYIFMNERGISCYFKNDCLWKYSWDEIADLRISKRYRQKAVEIFLKSAKDEEKVEYSYNYFQYGKKAKKALATYYPKEIKKLKCGLVNGRFID